MSGGEDGSERRGRSADYGLLLSMRGRAGAKVRERDGVQGRDVPMVHGRQDDRETDREMADATERSLRMTREETASVLRFIAEMNGGKARLELVK